MGQPGLQGSEARGDDASRASSSYVVGESSSRVRDLPERLQPREEVERLGVANVSDDVLLAVILRSGLPGLNVLDLARQLLKDYGSLTALSGVTLAELRGRRGVGKVKAQVLAASLEMGRRLNQEALPPRQRIRTPEDVKRVLEDAVRILDREVFWVLLLDTKNKLKERPIEISQGLLDASLVHPREVFREAIRSATAAVVLAHNHPSGDPSPSSEDLRVTRQLVEAGRIVDIKVLDHVILGCPAGGDGSGFLSMREEGVVDFGV